MARAMSLVLVGTVLLIASVAEAQVTQPTGTPQNVPFPVVTGQPNGVPNTQGMTPQQIWQMRALQSRGRSGGVQRGSPVIIGGYGQPGQPGMASQPNAGYSKAAMEKAKKDAENAAKDEERKRRLRELNASKKAAAAKK